MKDSLWVIGLVCFCIACFVVQAETLVFGCRHTHRHVVRAGQLVTITEGLFREGVDERHASRVGYP